MTEDKYIAGDKVIDECRSKLFSLANRLWEHPETGYKEYYASNEICTMLEENGFQVERGICDLPTALKATYGSGHPVIGLLAEFDALPGLSQCMVPEKKPLQPGAPGHGCGHSLMPSANILAMLAIRKEMEEKHLQGTLVFYGCPAEEVLTGKAVMAKRGAFRDLDVAFCWHPGKYNRASYSILTGVNGRKYHFHGKTAHAAVEPEQGRSALDAVELMNVGINYLREHVPYDVRMHYVITDGGQAPNIVPDHASSWYFDRALDIQTMREVEKRMTDVAKGAALMTGTTLEIEELGGCYPVLPNHVLGKLVDECMREIPQEPWSKEEVEYARKVNAADPAEWKKSVRYSGSDDPDLQIYHGVMPIDTDNDYGSSDVGDVGHLVPTTFFKTACYAIGAPGHSWQIAACLNTSMGEKGMVYGARILLHAAMKILENPELSAKAKAEFEQEMGGQTYVSLIPDSFTLPDKEC